MHDRTWARSELDASLNASRYVCFCQTAGVNDINSAGGSCLGLFRSILFSKSCANADEVEEEIVEMARSATPQASAMS